MQVQLLRHWAILRQNRCGVLLAVLCLFILTNRMMSGSRLGLMALNIALLLIMMLAVWALRLRRLAVVGIGVLGRLNCLP